MKYHIVFFLIILSFSGCIDLSEVRSDEILEKDLPAETCHEVPVCAEGGRTYPTDCDARSQDLAILHSGPCEGCEDTDSGININMKGNITSDEGFFSDVCVNNSHLEEYYCRGGLLEKAIIPCGNLMKCELGTCEKINNTSKTGDVSEEANPSCQGPPEPDPYSFGEVIFENSTYADHCVEYKVVKDYYCFEGELRSLNDECDPGDRCESGVCKEIETGCRESDDGNDTTDKGTTIAYKGMHTFFRKTDECLDQGTVIEHTCDGGKPLSEKILCGSGYKCISGRCIPSDCNDSDGGLDIFTEGTVVINAVDHDDRCMEEDMVEEYYCYGDDYRRATEECPQGYYCDDGECVED